MSLAVAGCLEQGGTSASQAAVVKDLGTRFEGLVTETVRLLTRAEPDPSSAHELPRMLAESVLHGPDFTLRRGTNEVLRGVITRDLGIR